MQEVRHSRKADICVSHLQDVRTSRCPVHHRSLHKLCNRYIATVRQTTGSLDQKGRGSTVSAGWLSHTLQHTLRTLNCALCPRHFCLTIQKKIINYFHTGFFSTAVNEVIQLIILCFFPLYFILEGFFIWAVDLCLVWMDGINKKLCVFILLTWFKPWFWGKLHFLLYQISTMRKENACDQDSNKKSAILVIVLASEKPGHESENETSWGTRYFRLWYKIEAFFLWISNIYFSLRCVYYLFLLLFCNPNLYWIYFVFTDHGVKLIGHLLVVAWQ